MSAAQFVYVLVERQGLVSARGLGYYLPPLSDDDGFIHASTRDQLVKSANQFYSHASEVIAMEVDSTLISSILKYEPGASGTLYPHIYGALRLSDVSRFITITRTGTGAFELPEELQGDVSPPTKPISPT